MCKLNLRKYLPVHAPKLFLKILQKETDPQFKLFITTFESYIHFTLKILFSYLFLKPQKLINDNKCSIFEIWIFYFPKKNEKQNTICFTQELFQ